MAQYPVAAVGQRLTAEFIASMLPQTVRKASNTARISTTTLTPDPDLTLPVEANSSYRFECMLYHDGAAAADFKWSFTAPSGSTGTYWISQLDSGAAATSADLNTWTTISGIPVAGTFAAVNPTMAMMTGVFQTAGTAGNFLLNWAQNVSTASNSQLRADSYMMLWRIG
jgi:hypothetical protein